VDKAEMLRAIAERGSWRGEATQARKYGTRIPVEVSSMVLRAESGQITGYVSVNRDITGRKRAEEALRKSEERYRELFENMMDGFAYCRMSFDDKDCPVDFVYLAVNTAFERLTGLKNAVGHRITEVIPGIKEAHPELFEIYGRVAMTGQPERFEVYFKPLAMWMSIAVYSPTEGYFVTVFDDITERKRAEEALRESHARLAHLSHRLVEAQEEERRRIARELHDEVGQSLTALTISLEGVSQLALEGAMRGKIAEIQELTKNLIAEVNALSVELRPRVLDDLGLIPGLLSLFSRFSSQTGVEIDFKHTGIKRKRVTPEIEISAYRIIQEALTNVVRHADVKTTSVRLQVEADMLWIQVQDEGKGFDLQQAMKAEDSMGLLSMTERAEQVGGWLEVQTAPGEGTLITCQLPLGGSHVDKEGV
jgi:PAS domain S-box-containing protein